LNRQWEIVQKLFILKVESDLDPEPQKVSEHGAPAEFSTYVFRIGTNIVGSLGVVSTFCHPFLDHITVCRGMVLYTTLKTGKNTIVYGNKLDKIVDNIHAYNTTTGCYMRG